MSLIDEARLLLDKAKDNPEALVFLISGAIDRLNLLQEGEYSQVFEEAWQTQEASTQWN